MDTVWRDEAEWTIRGAENCVVRFAQKGTVAVDVISECEKRRGRRRERLTRGNPGIDFGLKDSLVEKRDLTADDRGRLHGLDL